MSSARISKKIHAADPTTISVKNNPRNIRSFILLLVCPSPLDDLPQSSEDAHCLKFMIWLIGCCRAGQGREKGTFWLCRKLGVDS
jgi:hypothetical protein